MTPVHLLLQARVMAALQGAVPESFDALPPAAARVVPCANPQFGDYQWNGALPLAKTLKTNPRALAQNVLGQLDVADISEPPEIAGPGFVNFRLQRAWLEASTRDAMQDARCGVPLTDAPRTVVVDFSSPNVAKPMHVGHIRSTIIGDAIARLLRFSGHRVVTDNHIGDWGTQFGKIILGWKTMLDEANLARDPLSEMERLYREVNARCDADPREAEHARAETAKLQAGDPENRAIWERVRELSQEQFDAVYARLNIAFDHTLGESFYNDRLAAVVDELLKQGIARESEGAIAVFSDGSVPPKEDPFLVFRDGQWTDFPALLRKRDGAATYAATDMATLDYRWETFAPAEIAYVTDARQAAHFRQIFATWKRRHPSSAIALEHVAFGSVLGEDKTPLKTRAGENVKLLALLDEAQERTLAIVQDKNPDWPTAMQAEVARVIGMDAVKYADLAQNRATDYVFSWDKMLSLQGNTAPYLLNAYVRIRSIFRRANLDPDTFESDALVLEHPAEIELAKHLLRLSLAIEMTLNDYRPNTLTDYLFELAGKFHQFFENCPVLKSEEPLRGSRLNLCRLTGSVLQLGLSLLGIETVEQM